MNRVSVTAAMVAGALAILASGAKADAIDELLSSLKQKGVISESEYSRIAASREADKKQSVATVADKPNPNAVIGKFNDAITFETADGRNSFSVGGRVQLDARQFSGGDAAESDTYDIRRAQIGAKGKFLDYYSFDVSADLVKGSAGGVGPLETAYFDIAWWKSAQFRLGQFSTPFTMEDGQSSKYVDFMERAWANSFVQSPDRGVMVFGEPTTGFSYWLSSTNGRAQNSNIVSQTVDGKEITGRAVLNFAKFMDQKDAVYHFGLGRSESKQTGTTSIGSFRTEARSEQLRFMNIGAFAADSVKRSRAGLEIAVAKGPFKIQAESVKASYAGTTTPGRVGFDKDINTRYLNAMWFITGENYADSYSGGYFGKIKPYRNFDPKGGGWGAWELGLRLSRIDAGDFRTTDAAGSGVLGATGVNTVVTNGARSTTAGLKWIMNPNTRLMLNYVNTRFDSPVTSNGVTLNSQNAIEARAQFDF